MSRTLRCLIRNIIRIFPQDLQESTEITCGAIIYILDLFFFGKRMIRIRRPGGGGGLGIGQK